MTLKIYVPRDSQNRDWAPDHPHEVRACEWMIKKAWAEFQHLGEMYAILLNLQHPSPPIDMLVIHERGLGILELKDYPDEIHIRWHGPWSCGEENQPIEWKNGFNPRDQVQRYAIDFRSEFIYALLPPEIRDDLTRRDKFKFQTAVCFTNHLAVLDEAQDFIERHPPQHESWEQNFSVFGLADFTSWVRELRFELDRGRKEYYEPVRLTRSQIIHFATSVLKMVEWDEIYPAMLTGHPYGALVLEDGTWNQRFPLFRDQTLVGRSHKCEVDLPEHYTRVSKEHCVTEWRNGCVLLTDMPSRNGTFVNGQKVTRREPALLQNGDMISLGGSSKSSNSCVLKLELFSPEQTLTTELPTQIGQEEPEANQNPPESRNSG
jgi:hypothetical protein